MEIVTGIIVAVVLLAIAFLDPLTRRMGDAAEADMRGIAPGVDVNRQFQRPRNEGDLL